MTRIRNLSPIRPTIKESLNALSDDIREECIMAIKNKRNDQSFCNNNKGITPAVTTSKAQVTMDTK
jgi:hypothetical protein